MILISKLHFGCGKKIFAGWINVDIIDHDGVDSAFDFNKFPYPFKDNTFNEIFSDNVLEHLFDLTSVVHELHRISKNGCKMKIIVPYYNSYGACNDHTHYHYFNKNSIIQLFDSDWPLNKKNNIHFEIKKIDIRPTKIGKIFPSKILDIISRYVSNMVNYIEVEVVVIK